MNLYYLCGPDENGDDYTLHVRAPNMHQAYGLWLDHWFKENPETAIYSGQLIPGTPSAKADEKLLIYEIISDPDVVGVIEWGRNAIIMGHVNP
ncbi:hypothetical protein ELI44_32925 (plasmid) [Rhizobium ruizarguesonis]|uniref:hypothetical protein n=1 Tax=Rhizobium ruizarguesonis TaxID=2081791 RepID=UPI00103010AF|nr:hypothetical protein [Rhizobium ruizarguesonis]TAU37814.1 hypothetical protein ELI42_33210 [Rhizobium ruizarguesonis]TAU51271.1 hypothetical protein ELI44_32925 [Rhizobium ruizarguesonis]